MKFLFKGLTRYLMFALGMTLAATGFSVHAQSWPTARPVKIILPATPGGSSDPLARLMAEELGRTLGGNFIVENKPGANGNVGAAFVAKSDPDGYTILFS